MKPHVLERSFGEWEHWFQKVGEPSYRARQLFDAFPDLITRGPELLTTWPRALREQVFAEWDWQLFERVEEFADPEDGTRKLRLTLRDGKRIEAVLIPEPNRLTLCLSTQAGCAFHCSFCRTGWGGFERNLKSSEIVGQWLFARTLALRVYGRRITNLVFMGMGEPLHNYEELLKALDLLSTPEKGFGISPLRITVSTVGVLPALEHFLKERREHLAISLHAACPELREKLVPAEKAYPIAWIRELLLQYRNRFGRRKLTVEVVLLHKVNDRTDDALALATWARGLPLRVNLIPYNPYPEGQYLSPPWTAILRFQELLRQKGIPCFVRKPRGRGVLAACGNLAARSTEAK